MTKTFVGPRLRQLRRDRNQTQAQMAEALGVSAAYVNLLENNQRSLSVQVLLKLSDAYGVDWRDLVNDESSSRLADLRNALQDPVFGPRRPDLTELRAAVDHSPGLVDRFLQLYQNHRTTLDRLMRQRGEGASDALAQLSPEAVIHDFFRDHANHFPVLEDAAEGLRDEDPFEPDDVYATLKTRLLRKHGITVEARPVEEMAQTLRDYDRASQKIFLSEALDHQNRVFQVAHVLCLVEFGDLLDDLTVDSGIGAESSLARLRVELANYFAAALLMPYATFLELAEHSLYDIDRIAAGFGVSYEQVSQRLTTLQREGAQGVPFFFLRVDKAGNVTKRFNSTSFHLAEYGGACPVWNIHTAFRTPGVIVPQFVELPDGERYFTLSRTTERPVFSRETQDRRLAIALGCEARFAERIGYATAINREGQGAFSQIGINCLICPRQACSQRAHQPLHVDLPIDMNRRGNTRYES